MDPNTQPAPPPPPSPSHHYSHNPYYDERPGFGAQIVEFIQTLVVFMAIFMVIYLFIAQPHKVSGPSMFPTFKDGDYIITDKISYYFKEPKRGDVVVFKNPRNESQDFIKRVMALPGDRIKVEGEHVFVNDKMVVEPYLTEDILTEAKSFLKNGTEVTVPENRYVVFGDNREQSSDSREWGFITKEEIIGKVFFRYWPINEIGIFPGAYAYE